MATQEKTWNVANRLHSQKDSDNPEVNHIIAGADEIYDDAKGAKQSDINAQTGAALANCYTKAETYSKEQLDSMITTPDVNYVTVATFADLPQTGEADTVYRVSSYDGTQVDVTKYALYAWDGTTYQLLAVRSAIGEVVDVSEINSGATYTDLPAALAAVPDSVKRGGMSIKFIQRTNIGTAEEPVYNDEYVQYRYMGTSIATADFTNTANWQGIDEEPTAGSRNLVESGGIVKMLDELFTDIPDVQISLMQLAIIADGTFGTNTSSRHAGIPVKAGERYLIKNTQALTAAATYTRYAFVTSLDYSAGENIPLVGGTSVVEIPLGGSFIVTVPAGASYLLVNYNTTAYPLYVKGYAIIDDEAEQSNHLIRSKAVYDFKKEIESKGGLFIDYNHLYNSYTAGDPRNYYKEDANYNSIWIFWPKDAISVVINKYLTVTNYRQFSDYTPAGLNELGSTSLNRTEDTTAFPRYSSGAESKLMVLSLKKSNNADLDYSDIYIEFGYKNHDSDINALPNLIGKKISILGNSIDSFEGYSYWNNSGTIVKSDRYPGWLPINGSSVNNDVIHASQVWWMQVIERCGGILERNNSIGGSGVTYDSEANYNQPCALRRYADLGNPDVIFIHGLANESASRITWTFDPTRTTAELEAGIGTSENKGPYYADLGASYDLLVRKLMELYPNARIIHYIKSTASRSEGAIEIANYYNQEYINLNEISSLITTIGSGDVHPNMRGMKAVADYIIKTLSDATKDAIIKEEILAEANHYTDEKKEETEASIAFESEDFPGGEADILTYLTDKNNRCYGYIKKDGTVFLYKFEGRGIQLDLLNYLSADSPYNDPDVLKYLTDENDVCYGYIRKDGTVVLYRAKIEHLETNEDDRHSASEAQMAAVLGLLATGVDSIEMTNNPKMLSALTNLFTDKAVNMNADNKNAINIKPCLSIIDDDTADVQIPSSYGSDTVSTSTSGGFFSVLLPMMLSLGEKHGIKMPVGLACEGHRVGLTSYKQFNDDYSELNENGRAIKWLHDNMGWNVLNHSMTAQLPQRAYYVDGINSSLANTILAEGTYNSPLSFWNTMVLDRLTGKWYEVNSTKTAWVERTPTKKYAQLFYQDYNTKAWYFNRDFDFDYSWGEWFKRAEELGLPFEKVIVHNGGTTNPYTIAAGRHYAHFSIRTSGIYNRPPIPAAVNRADGDPSGYKGLGYNAYDETWVAGRKANIDNALNDGSWIILMTHTNDQEYFRNYYLDNKEYPNKDNNYSSEWIIPLKHEEIQDIIGDNVHDYINHPPSRLGINSWEEWHPAPGTHLAGLYEVLDYALTNGINWVSPMEGWKTHGNILNLGVDRNEQSYSYETAANQVPYTDEEKSYLTIGADMSIRYYNSKK